MLILEFGIEVSLIYFLGLNSQIKFYSAAPSLVTTSLIRTSLRDISNSFKMLSDSNLDQDFKESIQNIFIKSDH